MAPFIHPAAETVDRSTAVGSVLASFRMEGLEPDTETASLLALYEAGTLSLSELGFAIERHVAQMGIGEASKGAA
jgi:hypothetical protein